MNAPGLRSDSSTRQPANGSSQVMQHTRAFDEIEALRKPIERQDVAPAGTRYRRGPSSSDLALRIGKARQAEVHREHRSPPDSAAPSQWRAGRCRSPRRGCAACPEIFWGAGPPAAGARSQRGYGLASYCACTSGRHLASRAAQGARMSRGEAAFSSVGSMDLPAHERVDAGSSCPATSAAAG